MMPRLTQGRLVTTGNDVSLLVDGGAVFDAMRAAIAAAEFSICLETYIFAADKTGESFLEALSAASRRGVQVRVLVDGMGSLSTPSAFFAPLIAAGGQVGTFHRLRLFGPLRVFWRRDHRKLMVVDGHTAFIGGLNIADVHVSVAAGGAGWHDMHARVCGPAAQQLEQLFAGTWRRATKKRVMPRRHLVPDRGTTVVEILESRFGRNRSIQRAYIAAVHRARQRISICSAYFIPDRAFVRALVAARQRGVAVNLLLAGVSDVVPVQFASRALYKKLLSSGVLIYEWPKRVLHAKTIVTDGNWCSIGSYNMDRRSLLYNLEVNIACEDTAFAHAMEAQFDADRRVAAPVLLSVWHRRRALQKFLEQLFYLLRFWL